MEKANCGSCKYFKAGSGVGMIAWEGWCRFNPPVWAGGDFLYPVVTRTVRFTSGDIHTGDWCGKFERAK